MNAYKLAVVMIFHPLDAFVYIKRNRDKIRLWSTVLIYVIMVIERYLYILFVHKPLSTMDIQNTNIMLELAVLLLPILTWVVSIYGLTSVKSGENTLKEIYVASSFCLIPYIIITPLSILISQILSLEEQKLYSSIQFIMLAWIIILLFASVMFMNNYSFSKTVFISIISLIGILLIWAALLLVFTLAYQIVLFIGQLIQELEFSQL